MDVLILSRVQFALTAGFHYLFPPISIGLGVMLVIMEGLWLKTNLPIYNQMARFFSKIFGLTFAVGVATGIVMEFEFGTNWATYSRYVGDVFGSPLAAEGVFAFFLESSFLGLVLFGWDRVSRKLHYFATCMVCFGAHLSALWIVAANSWMQTPAGYKVVGEGLTARAEITDFWAMALNHSTVDRLSHTLSAAWITGAFLVISIAAWYLLRRRHKEFAMKAMKVGLIVAALGVLLQMATGHKSGQGVAKNQPAKLAAYEGLYQTTSNAPLYTFGWVDEQNEKVVGMAIPGMLSILAHDDINKPVIGLKDFKPEDRPPVQLSFQLYHGMIGVGMLLLGLVAISIFFLWRGTLDQKRWLLWILVFGALLPHFGNQLGWAAAEVGRQPWIVYNLLRTSDALSKVVQSGAVLTSIILFTLIYFLLLVLYLRILMDKIKHGPEESDLKPATKK